MKTRSAMSHQAPVPQFSDRKPIQFMWPDRSRRDHALPESIVRRRSGVSNLGASLGWRRCRNPLYTWNWQLLVSDIPVAHQHYFLLRTCEQPQVDIAIFQRSQGGGIE